MGQGPFQKESVCQAFYWKETRALGKDSDQWSVVIHFNSLHRQGLHPDPEVRKCFQIHQFKCSVRDQNVARLLADVIIHSWMHAALKFPSVFSLYILVGRLLYLNKYEWYWEAGHISLTQPHISPATQFPKP